MTEGPTYNEEVGRLKLEEIVAAGARIRTELGDGDVVGLSYQPGNGTAYDLVFTPVGMIHQLGVSLGSSWRVPTGLGADRESWVLLSKVNGMTWSIPILLDDPFHPGYLTGKTSGNWADGVALTALLRAVAGQSVLDPVVEGA